MSHTSIASVDEIVFRPFLPWFLAKNGLLLGAGALSITLSISDPRWWGGVALFVAIGMLLALHYASQMVIVRSGDLVIRYGIFTIHELSVPCWEADLQTHQSLLGRLFDYGTLQITIEQDQVRRQKVASLRALRYIIADRRQRQLWLFEPQPMPISSTSYRLLQPAREAAGPWLDYAAQR